MRGNGKANLRWIIQQKPQVTGITEIRNVPTRFGPQGIGDPEAAYPDLEIYPSGPLARHRFIQMNIEGHNVSEAFVRFPGKTPWKKIGELASLTGDFEEAIRVMWTILIKRSFYLYPKVRVWLPSDQPIEFGYADENADIVRVKDPLPEGIFPETTKKMLRNCGFVGIEKELEYLPAKKHYLQRIGPGGLKKQWHITGRSYLQYRKALQDPIWAQKWAQRSLTRHKQQMKGQGIRQVDWFGGMGRWAAKSHFQRVAGSNPLGSRKLTPKQRKFPSGGKDNMWDHPDRQFLQKRSLRVPRKPEGLPGPPGQGSWARAR
jgi:hypothetical protein